MRVELELTEKQAEMVKQYAGVYDRERKIDWTNTPIVVVEDENYVVSDSRFSYDKTVIYDENEQEEIEEEDFADYLLEQGFAEDAVTEIVEELSFNDSSMDDRFLRHYLYRIWEPKAYFFTRAEAEKYCKYQKHNLSNPRVFSRYSGYSNEGDFPVFVELLKVLGEQLLQEEK